MDTNATTAVKPESVYGTGITREGRHVLLIAEGPGVPIHLKLRARVNRWRWNRARR